MLFGACGKMPAHRGWTQSVMVSIGTGLGSAEELVFSYDDMRARE